MKNEKGKMKNVRTQVQRADRYAIFNWLFSFFSFHLFQFLRKAYEIL
jgi:hypothetical protein